MDSGVRFQELADAAPVLIWRVGTDGVYNWVNRTWVDFTGLSRERMSGLSWGEVIHEGERDRCRAQFRAAFDERRDFSLDYRIRRADGELRWMTDRGRPFFLSDGNFAGYLGTCLDISDRKHAELRAQTALADARRALRQRDVLLGEVHHRVKNNLQVILSLLSLRARAVPDAQTRDELLRLARRIQAMGHVQAEIHGEHDVTRIVLVDFLRRLGRPLAVLHGCDHIDVQVEGLAVPIEAGTASIVGLIMAELISNSFSHAFPRGVGDIRIRVREGTGGRIAIDIHDTGAGFDATAAEQKGSVGLTIVRSLARQGDIVMRHHPGAGAGWTLTLPPSIGQPDSSLAAG
ncbi:sensor histidine kinase [Alsobacter sp. R-9]